MEKENEDCNENRTSCQETDEILLLQLLENGISENTQENIAFGKEISTILNKLDLDVKSLPFDIQSALQKVSVILRAEKMPYIDDTLLKIIIENNKINEKRKQREEKRSLLCHDVVFRKQMLFLKKLEELQENTYSLEQTCNSARKHTEDSYSECILLTKKLNDYQETVQKLETNLRDMHVNELYAKDILDKYNKYMEMITESANLDRFLSQFKDLPCNLLQAKALLEIKRREYEKLEKTFLEKTS